MDRKKTEKILSIIIAVLAVILAIICALGNRWLAASVFAIIGVLNIIAAILRLKNK